MYFSKKISQTISDIMIDSEIVEPTKRDILIYCFEYIFDQIIYTTLFLVLGVMLKQIEISLLFLIMFYSLRSFGGGFHASTETKCTILSFIVYLSVLLIAPIITYNHSSLWLTIFSLSIVGIIILSPIESANKVISSHQKRKMKSKCTVCCIMLSILFILLYTKELQLYYGTMAICAILIIISMVLGFATNKLSHNKTN